MRGSTRQVLVVIRIALDNPPITLTETPGFGFQPLGLGLILSVKPSSNRLKVIQLGLMGKNVILT